MNGKLIILIVIIVTLIGVGLAWYFLQTLPSSGEEQSLHANTVLYVNNWFSSTIHSISS